MRVSDINFKTENVKKERQKCDMFVLFLIFIQIHSQLKAQNLLQFINIFFFIYVSKSMNCLMT